MRTAISVGESPRNAPDHARVQTASYPPLSGRIGAETQLGVGAGVVAEGKVFIYPGRASNPALAATPAVTLENPAHQDQGHFGNALAIGDFDGDGYADLAVAARQQDAVGRVFIYRGGAGGVSAPASASLDDPVIATNASFGYALAAGDFDGDGYADLAVSAATETVDGKPQVGHVYLFHGGPAGIADRAAPWKTLENPSGSANSLFGWAVVAADFNADDIDDLVVSAVYQDVAAGRVYVYQGATAGPPAQPTTTMNDPAPANNNDFFGYVLAVGDRGTSDGFADLFLGASRNGGTIYLFDGGIAGLPAVTATTITGASVPGGDRDDDHRRLGARRRPRPVEPELRPAVANTNTDIELRCMRAHRRKRGVRRRAGAPDVSLSRGAARS